MESEEDPYHNYETGLSKTNQPYSDDNADLKPLIKKLIKSSRKNGDF